MIHIGNKTKSNIVSYGVATGNSKQTFRSLVAFNGKDSKNASKCDSRLIGKHATANTIPTIIHNNGTNQQSHEATTGAIDAETLFFLEQSGISTDTAIALIIGANANPIISRLPMEFLVESKQLIQMAIHKE
jgi:Fe-S cluster assembly protein SufB